MLGAGLPSAAHDQNQSLHLSPWFPACLHKLNVYLEMGISCLSEEELLSSRLLQVNVVNQILLYVMSGQILYRVVPKGRKK